MSIKWDILETVRERKLQRVVGPHRPHTAYHSERADGVTLWQKPRDVPELLMCHVDSSLWEGLMFSESAAGPAYDWAEGSTAVCVELLMFLQLC